MKSRQQLGAARWRPGRRRGASGRDRRRLGATRAHGGGWCHATNIPWDERQAGSRRQRAPDANTSSRRLVCQVAKLQGDGPEPEKLAAGDGPATGHMRELIGLASEHPSRLRAHRASIRARFRDRNRGEELGRGGCRGFSERVYARRCAQVRLPSYGLKYRGIDTHQKTRSRGP